MQRLEYERRPVNEAKNGQHEHKNMADEAVGKAREKEEEKSEAETR